MKKIESNKLDELREEVLKAGTVYKQNYNDLCEWIGWKPSSNRVAQFKSICHWMKVEKVNKNSYVISEVYNIEEAISKFKKPGKVKQKSINPQDYIFKRPVGRPRTNAPKLSIREIEERQGYSLFFRPTSKYIELAYHIIGHDILNNNGVMKYTGNGLITRLGMIQYNNNDLSIINKRITDTPELMNFWYYVNTCCETILRTNIIDGLCDRKHIFDNNEIYYNADWNITEDKYRFATDAQNIIIQNIVDQVLEKWELSGYYCLYFQNSQERYKALEAKKEIKAAVKNEIGWNHLGKGYKMNFTPQIPINAVEYLKTLNIEADRINMNGLIRDRIKKILSDKNAEYLNYSPSVSKPAIIIGTGVDAVEKAHNLFNETVADIVDNYLIIK